jgi:hypothetical protein
MFTQVAGQRMADIHWSQLPLDQPDGTYHNLDLAGEKAGI